MALKNINNGFFAGDPNSDSVFQSFEDTIDNFEYLNDVKLEDADLDPLRQNILNAANGIIRFDTLADLNLNTGDVNTQYIVTQDGINNGYYSFDGANYVFDRRIEGDVQQVNDIDSLRNVQSISEICYVNSYYPNIVGGGGVFIWDENSEETDNNGTIFKVVNINVGRWKRVLTDNNVYASWFGAKKGLTPEDDSTIQLREAINFAANGYNLILDNQYYISIDTNNLGLDIPSNSNIIFQKNSSIKVLPSDRSSQRILNISGVSNVSISGQGEVIGEKNEHIGTVGEFGHGITVDNSQNITIKDVKVSECWGDGLVVQSSGLTNLNYNILIDNVVSTDNRRQGLTISSGKNITVLNSSFNNTDGTLPEAGIDIEPNSGGIVDGVFIQNCEMKGNSGSGIAIIAIPVDATVKNITIDQVRIEDNFLFGFVIESRELINPVDNVTVSNMQIQNAGSRPSMDIKIANRVKLENITINDTSSFLNSVFIGDVNDSRFNGINLVKTNPSNGIGIRIDQVNNLSIEDSIIESNARCINTIDSSGLKNKTGLSLKNIYCSSFTDRALYLTGMKDLKIDNLNILEAGFDGIFLENSLNASIKNSRIENAGSQRNLIDSALNIRNSTNTLIQKNVIKKGNQNTNTIKNAIFFDALSIENTVKDNQLVDLGLVSIDDRAGSNFINDESILKQGTTSQRPLLTNNSITSRFQYFDTTLGYPIYVKGETHQFRIQITLPASSSGNVTITANGNSMIVPITSGDTENEVAEKIVSGTLLNYNVGFLTTFTNRVLFTRNIEGEIPTPVFDSGGTGVGAVITVNRTGIDKTWVDSLGNAV